MKQLAVTTRVRDSSMPLYAFGSVVVFVGAIVTLDVTGHGSDSPMFIALLVSTLPSLVAAIFSEKSSRDLRNGVVEEKARSGAAQAISDTNVITRDGPVVTASLDALTSLLTAVHPDKAGAIKRVGDTETRNLLSDYNDAVAEGSASAAPGVGSGHDSHTNPPPSAT